MRWLISLLAGSGRRRRCSTAGRGPAAGRGRGGAGGTLKRAFATPLPALLRAAALAVVSALLLNAPAGPSRVSAPWVALDASAEHGPRGDSAAWRAAVGLGQGREPADSVFLFGDSLRAASPPPQPTDRHSDVDAVVAAGIRHRTARGGGHRWRTAAGRPNCVSCLPARGWSWFPTAGRRDAAAVDLDVPRAVVSGDTTEIRLTVGAGSGGAAAGSVRFLLDGRLLGTARFDSLGALPNRTSRSARRSRRPRGRPNCAPSWLDAGRRRATERHPGRRHRPLAAAGRGVRLDLSRLRRPLRPGSAAGRAGAAHPRLLSPCRPATGGGRELYARDRSRRARRIPRCAGGHSARRHARPSVRPRQATRAPLALVVPSAGDGSEWYASAAPASPLSSAHWPVSPWDSLPPLLVGGGPEPRGQWRALEARRGREVVTRTIVAGDDAPRRVVVVAASDLWRWEFRGGVSADAFTALWGSIFDYVASQRADRRAAVPDAAGRRAGEPIAWRRGAPATALSPSCCSGGARAWPTRCSCASPAERRRDPSRRRSPPGRIRGARWPAGSAVLVVNAATSWCRARPRVRRGAHRRSAAARRRRPARATAGGCMPCWLLLLCANGCLRRRAGLR